MLLSELVSICAKHRLDSEPTLTMFARELREAGRVSKAGRGRGAARMTYLDGARFLIACAATDHPKRAADAEATFSNTLFDEGRAIVRRDHSTFVDPADAAPTLDLALASVLEAIADGSLDKAQREMAAAEGRKYTVQPQLSLDVFRGGVSAVLRAGARDLHYSHPAQLRMHGAKDSDEILALSDAWMRETERFRTGKNLHATLDSALLRDVANAIAGVKPA